MKMQLTVMPNGHKFTKWQGFGLALNLVQYCNAQKCCMDCMYSDEDLKCIVKKPYTWKLENVTYKEE